MSYTITTTTGVTLATVTDGTINTTATSLTLVGKNYAGYGVFLNENYVKLLENFNSTSAPSNAITGQLWYDTTNATLKVYSGTQWKPISSSASGATQPSSPVTGDLWWDSTNAQLKVWSGSTWVTIGPAYSTVSGTNGAIVETILDSGAASHVVIKNYVSNQVVSITSKDAEFTPQTTITGFATVKPGVNLVSPATISGAKFHGNATNADTLGTLSASQFLRSDQNTVSTYTFTIRNNTGLTVGGGDEFTVSAASNNVNLRNTYSNKDLNLYINKGGVDTKALGISGTSANITVAGSFLPSATTTYNIGSTGAKFANVYATYFVGQAITASYADLAERFEADEVLPAGTVVELGGLKEIRAVVEDLSEAVFGVISTAAGFLMNGSAGSNETHPPVAVNGRVPVRVVGQVNKGDRLVSAGHGLARSARRDELTAFNVIGRALESKTTENEGTIEAIVKITS